MEELSNSAPTIGTSVLVLLEKALVAPYYLRTEAAAPQEHPTGRIIHYIDVYP